MIGFNHALTGGLLTLALPLPAALPLAFASHFVLDMLPHYGIPQDRRDNSFSWKAFFIFDTLATLGLAIYALVVFNDIRISIFLGGLLATMPDYLWVGRVIRTGSFHLGNNTSRFTKWHASIQRYERPWGIWLELPLAAVLFYAAFFVFDRR